MDGMPPILDTVFRVAVHNITPLWPQVEKLLEIPLAMRPTHNAEDVWKLLMAMQSQLWVQMPSPPIVEACVVTEFVAFPRGVWLRAWMAAANEDVRFDHWRFVEALKKFARDNGCRGISGDGRIGWLRKYPEAVFEGVSARITF